MSVGRIWMGDRTYFHFCPNHTAHLGLPEIFLKTRRPLAKPLEPKAPHGLSYDDLLGNKVTLTLEAERQCKAAADRQTDTQPAKKMRRPTDFELKG